MTERDERAVRTALEAEADRLAVPSPALAELLAGGRAAARARRRQIGTGVAAAVLAVAAGGAVAAQPGLLGSQGPVGPASQRSGEPAPTPSAPSTLADLPQGDPPGMPFFERGLLHSGDAALEADFSTTSLVVGDGTVVTETLGQSGLRVVRLLDRASGEQTLLTDQAAGPPVVGVDGRYAAWQVESPDPGSTTVQLWDVGKGARAGTVTFPFQGVCCDNPFRLLGIDAEGRVYGAGFASGRDLTWVAEQGSRASVVEGLGRGFVTEVAPWGVVLTVEPSSKSAGTTQVLGRIDSTATFRELARLQSPQATVSWDGASIAYLDMGRLLVRDIDSGRERTMLLPNDARVDGILWEDDTALLVQVTGSDRDAWVRCSAETGACELAARLRRPYDVPRPR
jgi:hypothetical protein